jgi:hypothetical protein
MNIEITRPEVEALIQQRLKSGGFKDPQDVIFHALRFSESRPSTPELLVALRSSPEQDAEEAPSWLKETWANAREAGLASMSMEEIDAEIAVARQARRQPSR